MTAPDATRRPVRSWRLHVGAHKTATTHLQDNLAARREALAALGIDFVPMRKVRALRQSRLLPPPSGWRNWRLRLGFPMRWRLQAALAPLRLGPGRVIVSEENLIGVSKELLGDRFYPRAAARLRPFRTLAGGGADLQVFFAVRDPATLLPSAYAQTLRSDLMPGGFAPIGAAALRRPPRWSELIERLRATLPRARLRVWTFEDYVVDPERFMRHLCGVPIPPGPQVAPSARTRSPSAPAVAALEGLATPGTTPAGRAARMDEAHRIAERFADGEPFRPFAPHEARLLSEAYQEDLDRLERAWPGTLLRADPAGG